MRMDFNQDFFTLFQLPRRFALDRAALDAAYRRIQGEVHPDRFAASPEAERRLALQWPARATKRIKPPASRWRARDLLALAGVDTAEDTNTAMPAEFLMQMQNGMARRHDGPTRAARDADALETLIREDRAPTPALEAELAAALTTAATLPPRRQPGAQAALSGKLEADLGEALEAACSDPCLFSHRAACA